MSRDPSDQHARIILVRSNVGSKHWTPHKVTLAVRIRKVHIEQQSLVPLTHIIYGFTKLGVAIPVDVARVTSPYALPLPLAIRPEISDLVRTPSYDNSETETS